VGLVPLDVEPWRATIRASTASDGHVCESPPLAPGESWACECGNVLEMRGDDYYVQPSVTAPLGSHVTLIQWREPRS
jgi:hypothetical protein